MGPYPGGDPGGRANVDLFLSGIVVESTGLRTYTVSSEMPPAILIKGECRAVESTFFWPLRFWFVGVSAAVLVAQVGQIGPANADIGFQPPDTSFMSLVIAVSAHVAFTWINRRGTQRPSDYFRFLHAVGVVLALLILHKATGPTMPAMWLFVGLLLLALLLLMMASLGAWVPPMKSPGAC